MRPAEIGRCVPLETVRFGKHWERTAREDLEHRRNRQIMIELFRNPEGTGKDTFEIRYEQLKAA